jgi:hypothetical protein
MNMDKISDWFSKGTYRERRTERIDMLPDSAMTQILKFDIKHNIVKKIIIEKFIV